MGAADALHGSSEVFMELLQKKNDGKCSEAAILQSVPVRKAACLKYSRGGSKHNQSIQRTTA